ncbi:hypothetical protein [Haloferula sp. BvORR071]|uniref:hypothetical protein n=1 Tax=Haloferula sp. BvORR071 TaxID=1396141 RepID=UPI0005539EC9|nr:hypothetical protein [Haloferula sp. BvORR071]
MTKRSKIIALFLTACVLSGAGVMYFRSRPRILDLRAPASERCPLHGVSLEEESMPNRYRIYHSEALAKSFPMINNEPGGVADQRVTSILRSYCSPLPRGG